MKVLVADDSGIMRKIIIKELNALGISDGDIVEAVDGAEAVNWVNKDTFQAILMDWNMPNKLGIDAVKEIRAAGNKTPIMMVTTESEKANVVQAIQLGANNYLAKPFTKEDFTSKFKQLVGM
jgi:two-component system, chemotaxis family, chemotaxis protein CheY